ncbi:MAG TPA: MFS transporter [Trueperaceae bacterium]
MTGLDHSPFGARAVALYLTGLAAFTGLYLPQPILPLLADEFGLEAGRAALLISVTILGIALASPLLGVLADRFGRRNILLIGSLLLGAVSLGAALSPTFTLLLGFRLAQGLLLPSLLAVGIAYVSDALPVHTMRVVAGLYIAATVTGGMMGRVVSGTFADLVGWRYGFLLSAALYLLLVPLWARLRPLRPGSGESSLRGALAGTLGHFRNRQIVAGLLIGFFLFFAFQATFTYLPFRLSRPPFEFTSSLIGLTYITYSAGVLSSTVAGPLSRVSGLGATLAIGFGLTIAGNALTLAPGLPLVLAGLLVLCFGNFLVQGLAVGHVATSAESDRAGANALYLLLYYLGGSLGAYLPGFLFPLFGYAGVIACGIVALLAGSASVLLLPARNQPPAKP